MTWSSAWTFIIPTYRRPQVFHRCLASIRWALPEAMVIAVIQDDTPAPDWVRVVRMEPGYAGPRRHAGALEAIRQGRKLLCFLDDDHTVIADMWAWWRLSDEVRRHPRKLYVLPLREGEAKPVVPAGICGGFVITAETYLEAGGFGEDYLDDIEFSLRCHWAGIPVWYYPGKLTRHGFRRAGGLRALPEVEPKRTAHLRLSRLDERYPGRVVRSKSSWWGFRLVNDKLSGT